MTKQDSLTDNLTDGHEISKRDHSYQRVLDYRDRLKSAPEEFSRWEIVASDTTRSEVKRIAKENSISPGVAADALLGLGIETYKQRGALQATAAASVAMPFIGAFQASVPSEKQSISGARCFSASAGAAESLSALPSSSVAGALTKPLASYSARLAATSPTSASLTPPGTDATTPLDGFLAKAMARRKS